MQTEPLPATIQQSTAEVVARLSQKREADAEEENKWAKEEESRRIQLCLRRLQDSLGERYSYKRCHPNFSTFIVEGSTKRAAVVERLEKFDVVNGRGLILYGTVGTGKDHLLATMLYRACVAGVSAGWINGPELFGRFRDGFDGGERENEIMSRLVQPKVLGISDPVPQVGDASSWRTEILYRVIDLRYRQLRPTWLTINALSPDDADKKLTAQVFDRARDDAELVACFWPSYREGKS